VVDARFEAVAAQLRKEDELAVESTGNTRLFHDAVIEHMTRPELFQVSR
jgi:hypothetical protein